MGQRLPPWQVHTGLHAATGCGSDRTGSNSHAGSVVNAQLHRAGGAPARIALCAASSRFLMRCWTSMRQASEHRLYAGPRSGYSKTCWARVHALCSLQARLPLYCTVGQPNCFAAGVFSTALASLMPASDRVFCRMASLSDGSKESHINQQAVCYQRCEWQV